MTKADINLHANKPGQVLSVKTNEFKKEKDGMDFNTLVMEYGMGEITMFFRDDEAFISSLKKLIDCAQARLDTLMTLTETA